MKYLLQDLIKLPLDERLIIVENILFSINQSTQADLILANEKAHVKPSTGKLIKSSLRLSTVFRKNTKQFGIG